MVEPSSLQTSVSSYGDNTHQEDGPSSMNEPNEVQQQQHEDDVPAIPAAVQQDYAVSPPQADGEGPRPAKRTKTEDSETPPTQDDEDDDSYNNDNPQQQQEEDQQEEQDGLRLEVEDTSDDEELYRRILQAAAAKGIPLDFLQAHLFGTADPNPTHQDDNTEEVDYPFEEPPQSLADVAAFLQSPQCRKVLILAGAGMSVASGIPDFRSPQTGLYDTLDASTLTTMSQEEEDKIRSDPSYCLDQHLFLSNPLPCLEVNRDFVLGIRRQQWKPTLAHRFVEQLQLQPSTRGKLCRLYTQNIDGLEDQCPGIQAAQNRIAVHGSMDEAACAVCGATMPFEEFCTKMRHSIKDISGRDSQAPASSTPISCLSCGAPSVKPNIVLFRSSLPQTFFQNVPDDVRDVDLLLVVGTSLQVAPANSLVWRVPRHCMRVLVNRDPVGWQVGWNHRANPRDWFGQGDCESVMLDLMTHLGWLDSLQPLLMANLLPASSHRLLQERLSPTITTTANEEESTTSSSNNDETKQDSTCHSTEELAAAPAVENVTTTTTGKEEQSTTSSPNIETKGESAVEDLASSGGGKEDAPTSSDRDPQEPSSSIEEASSSIPTMAIP